MNEKEFEQTEQPHPAEEPTIHVNDYGATPDSTVVIEEADRTVLLTKDQTIIIPKETLIELVPKNRPRKIYGGMWGPTEIATVGVSMLAVLAVILLFVFLVMPAQNELAKNKTERDRLEAELRTSKSRYGSITSTEQGVAKLISSVDDFETRFLPVAANGRNALYQRINGLIGGYGLVNTTGPDYVPLEPTDGRNGNQSQSEQTSGKAKFQSIFPGVYVTMTVEGSYQNLRRFIREIETSDQFVVISAVELEPTENKDKDGQTAAAASSNGSNSPNQFNQNQFNQINQLPQNNPIAGKNPIAPNQFAPPQPEVQPQFPNQTKPTTKIVRGKTHGETVSLHLEMAAYFRRPNFVPMSPDPVTP